MGLLKISKGITIQAKGLTKVKRCDIIQSANEQYKMNVLKAGGKGECYEWMQGKKERMSNVLTVGRYIY